MKEYRDEAMKYVDAAERAANGSTADPSYQLNAAIAAALVDIAETLHGIRAELEAQRTAQG
ncbi:MAG: hypothetical protein ACJ76V_08490 [Thermoleophilaceae bacterium]